MFLCVFRRRADGVFSCRLIVASLQCLALDARIMILCLLMLSGYEGYTGVSLGIDLHFNVWCLGLVLTVEKYNNRGNHSEQDACLHSKR